MMTAQVGYAADDLGNGIAYARLVSRTGERLVRVAFRVKRFEGLGGREIGYAALSAVASMLAERGMPAVTFSVPDGELALDVAEHRDVPSPLVIPYVRLGCALNRFASFGIERGEDADLDARARAELFIHSAA
jgi:hypothetical protein